MGPKIQFRQVLLKIGRQYIIHHPKISQNQLKNIIWSNFPIESVFVTDYDVFLENLWIFWNTYKIPLSSCFFIINLFTGYERLRY